MNISPSRLSPVFYSILDNEIGLIAGFQDGWYFCLLAGYLRNNQSENVGCFTLIFCFISYTNVKIHSVNMFAIIAEIYQISWNRTPKHLGEIFKFIKLWNNIKFCYLSFIGDSPPML
jgi:hypothetical protein